MPSDEYLEALAYLRGKNKMAQPVFSEEVHEILDTMETLAFFGAVGHRQESRFNKKRRESIDQKKALAKHLKRELLEREHKNVTSGLSPDFASEKEYYENAWFLGAGTTIAFFANEIRRFVGNNRLTDSRYVITNNAVVADALSSCLRTTKLIGGFSYRQHRATLPTAFDPDDRALTYLYQKEFETFVDEVKRCSEVILTTSRFSAILGPMVHTIENAVAKRGIMHAATERKPASTKRLLLSFDKVIPIDLDSYADAVCLRSEPKSELTPWFPISATKLRECISNQPENIRRWLDKVPGSWHRNAMKLQRLLKSNEGQLKHLHCNGLNVDRMWFDFDAAVEITIGLPKENRESAIARLCDEFKFANDFFANCPSKLNANLYYRVRNRDDSNRQGVLIIDAESIHR